MQGKSHDAHSNPNKLIFISDHANGANGNPEMCMSTVEDIQEKGYRVLEMARPFATTSNLLWRGQAHGWELKALKWRCAWPEV